MASFYPREIRGISSLFLGNLTSLQQFEVALLCCEGVSLEEAEQAKAALTHAAEMHPNHPSHSISIHL
jgi:hypothetical protein